MLKLKKNTDYVKLIHGIKSRRASFTLQKMPFCTSKGHLLPCKRASFTMQKTPFYFAIYNLLIL